MSEDHDTTPRRPGAKRARRWLAALTALLLAAALAAVMLPGTRMEAPDWLRRSLAERVNGEIAGFRVRFGSMALTLERDWVPRLALRDVEVTRENGDRLATLSDVSGTLALGPLLRGQVHPSAIRLSGARVKLRRAADGGVGLAVGETSAAVREAATFAGLLEQSGAFLQQPHFSALTRVEADNLTVQYDDARIGQAWAADGGRLSLTRDGDDLQLRGDVALLGDRGYATTLEMNYAGRVGNAAAKIGISFEDMPARDIAGQSPALTWLDALDAPISGALRLSVGRAGALGPLNASLRIGPGVLQPTDATRPIPFSEARAYFTYEPDEQLMRFDEIFLDSPWVTARAEGKAFLAGLEDGWPRELFTQFRFSEITANPDRLYERPVRLEGATMDMRLRMDPFLLSLGEMSIADQGQRLVLSGALGAEADGWNLRLDGRMGAIAPARLLELWPRTVKAKTRKWISENVRQADLSDIQLALRSRPGQRPEVFLGFDFSDLETRFMKRVPVIRRGAGHGSIYDNRFVVSADRGHVTAAQGGRIDISGTRFMIPDIRIKRGPAQAQVTAVSPITAALSLLDEEPFRFLQKVGKPVTLADGRARMEGQLDFLLKPDLQPEEVAFRVTGTLHDVTSDVLAEGRRLSAGKLRVVADNRYLEISGDGRIGRVPAQGRWRMEIGEGTGGGSRLTGTIELSERFAEEFRIGLPPGAVTGTGSAAITLEFAQGEPGAFDLHSDLHGVGLALTALDWSLAPEATGVLEVAGQLGRPPAIDRLRLDADGLRARGAVTLTAEGGLDRAVFSEVQVAEWLDGPVELVGRGAGRPPGVRVTGGTVDLRRTALSTRGQAGGNDGGESGSGPLTLTLDRLQISDGIALTGFSAELETAGGMKGRFAGRVNGGAAISGRVAPQGGRSAFHIRSSDAGGVLRSAGVIEQARDGDLELVLYPAETPGEYNGRLRARNMRLRDAPALAALLNALSIVGLLEQLSGEGIHFTQVESKFRLSEDRVTVTSSSAIGASMGISMDGYYFMEKDYLDMRGVFSPFYLVNALGGIFTRRGEGLVGFSYELKGPADSPAVAVNPLSMLTPGMFREIFRRPPPVLDGAPPAAADQSPPSKPRQDLSR